MTLTETPPTDAGAPAKPARWTAQWKELYAEVITTGLCTGCAGCVVTCPHDVIGYEHEEGKYIPFHLEEELGLDDCVHGSMAGCTTCTRACPRFRAWEPAADMHLFGRVREPDEMAGIWRQLLLTRAADDDAAREGPGRRLRHGDARVADGERLHRRGDGVGRRGRRRLEGEAGARPQHEEILATAGSRYTYCANPLALRQAKEEGLDRLALVGMGCQTS